MSAKLNIGNMDRRIRIQGAKETVSESGAPKQDWINLDFDEAVWAEEVPLRTSESFLAQQTVAENVKKFRIRHLDGLSEKMRILDVRDQKKYNIIGINPIGRNYGLEITASVNRESN